MQTTGERIKHLRKSVNMTQSELGDLLGVQKSSIQKYENGSVVNLKTDTVEAMAKIFNVTPGYILGWDEFDKEIDVESLSNDVSFLEEVHKRFGYMGVELCELCSKLNDEGKRKIIFYAEDILGNSRYTE